MEKWIYKIEAPKLDNETCLFHETLFHNANGYLGVRSCPEEGYPPDYDTVRGTYINGFYDLVEVCHAEKLHGFIDEKQVMLNIADTQTIEVYLESERFSMFEGEILAAERSLDFKAGTTGRSVIWRSPLGKEVRINTTRLVSHALLNLFVIEYTIEPLNFSGTVRLVSSHRGLVYNHFDPRDPRVAAEKREHLFPVGAETLHGASVLVSKTARSDLRICSAVKNVLPSHPDAAFAITVEGHCAVAEAEVFAARGERVTLVKYSTFADSIRCSDCRQEAVAALERAMGEPLSFWYERQREVLAELWQQTSLQIEGDLELDLALRYNIYQLFQSAGRDHFSSVSAKGLSGEGYEGHFFWDTEIYIQPFFILNFPSIAKNLLSYRYRILDSAREHAKIMGHSRGALYPWRTIMGSECSGYFPSGSAQYHINGAIALSVLLYYFASGDFEFIVEKGAEMVIETARLWLDAGHYKEGKFHIYAVSGPDEYTCIVNDNFYTNLAARYNLLWAVRLYRRLKEAGREKRLAKKIGLTEQEVAAFEQAAAGMYVPYDEELGIHAQDEAFLQKPVWDLANTPAGDFPLLLHYHPLYLYRYQVCKQADTVLAYFLFGDALDTEIMRRSFQYYEKITTHDSSLSACVFSIVASQLGFDEKAAYYFGDSAKLDLLNTHGNTKDGLHTANLGGSYMAVVYGFGGLRLYEDRIDFNPKLPRGWTGYGFQITYRGSGIHVQVETGRSRFRLTSGMPAMIRVCGKEYELRDELVIEHLM